MAKFKILQTAIDLETYGRDHDAAIASIGIVTFFVGDTFKIEDTFYRNIDQKRNKELGRCFDPVTIAWWQEQNKEAQKALMSDQQPLDDVMRDMCAFIDKKSMIWCQGTDFDIPIIKSTLKQLNLELPWNYRNLRDSRTFTSELGFDMTNYRSEGHHNALQDAIDQAKVVNHLKRSIEKSQS